MATGSLGYIVDFNTTSTNLSVSLLCGQSYNVSVQAHSDDCESLPSTPVVFRLGMSLKLDVNLLCTKHKSTSINTKAVCNFLFKKKRELIANNSVIWVSMVGSELTYLSNVYCDPAPCTPLNLVTYFECDNQLGSVSWGPSDGANMYTATAVGEDGHSHLCVTNGTSCTWENLHCGEIYTVTVTANDSRCTSARSNSTTIHMGKTRL